MILSEAYSRLREHFGSHGAAAKYLGLTEQHYNALRSGRANMPKRTADYILMKAQDLSVSEVQPTPDHEAEAHPYSPF